MAAKLSGSVGKQGKNDPADVTAVQKLLLEHGFQFDDAVGVCGPKTTEALLAYQRGFLKVPDGKVDPNGLTWHHLTKAAHYHAPLHPESPFTRLVPRLAKSLLNPGLTAVGNNYMKQVFGDPRDTFSQDCQPVTNVTLKKNIVSASVGKFKVQGLAPAISSLQEVFAEIKAKQSDVYDVLGTAGMLCCRYQRNSTTAISNHSWGTAVDLTTAGILDKRGDGQVQYGMTLIAPIFNQFGWYWGAAFKVEDGMHFEASKKLIDDWKTKLK